MTWEIKLLQDAQNGSAAAFEQIVKKYQALVCAITFSGTGRVDVSEELAQETFLSVWKNLRQLKNPDGFRPWLCTIARNMVNSYYRKKKTVPLDPSVMADLSYHTSTPSDHLITQEEHMMLEHALMRIPAEYREPLVMYYRQDKSIPQVAVCLNLNESTVRTRLHRARQMLRDEIAERIEKTIEHSAPGKAFTKTVMLAVGGAAIGVSAGANAASAVANGAVTATSSGMAAFMSTVTAKIVIAAAMTTIAAGAVLTYRHLAKQDQPSASPAQQAVMPSKQALVAPPEKLESVPPAAQDIRANSVDAPAQTRTSRSQAVSYNTESSADTQTQSPTAAALQIPVPTAATQEPPPDTENTFTVNGTLINVNAIPVADAKVILYHDAGQLNSYIVEETTSDNSGRFAFTTPVSFENKTSHSYANDAYIVLAFHQDYALAWHYIRQGQEQENAELILTEPTSRTITVTDHAGNPLEGARVWPYSMGDRTSSNPLFRDYLGLSIDIGLLGDWTDKDGQATITNLPATRSSLHAALEGYATGLAFPGGKTIRLSPGANVAGRVLTGNEQPVEGAVVRFQTKWMWKIFSTKTDADGCFFFKDLPAEGWDMSPWGEDENADGLYDVTVKHDQYSIPGQEIQLLPGEDIDDFVIVAGNGTLIECRVIAADTNMPMAGARIQGSSPSGRLDGYSDKNGIFSVRVEPGPVSLYFTSPPDGVYVLEDNAFYEPSLRFEAAGEKMEKVLKTPPIAGPLVTVFGYVRGPDNVGQSDAVVYAEAEKRFETSTAGSYIRSTGTDFDGQFELKEVPAGLNLHLYTETKNRDLAGTAIFEIPADPNDIPIIEITLRSTQRAEQVLADLNGSPVCNTDLQIRPVVGGQDLWGGYDRYVRTDGEGILRIDGILPDIEYYLRDNKFEDLDKYTSQEREKWFQGRVKFESLNEIK